MTRRKVFTVVPVMLFPLFSLQPCQRHPPGSGKAPLLRVLAPSLALSPALAVPGGPVARGCPGRALLGLTCHVLWF